MVTTGQPDIKNDQVPLAGKSLPHPFVSVMGNDDFEIIVLKVQSNGKFNRLSLTSMLIPTNDAIVGLRSMNLPSRSAMAAVPVLDAGTEMNDEDCDNIPGPDCGGEGFNPVGGEGYVYISNGISGIGDLAPYAFDWRNPVARVVVTHKQ